MTDPKKLARFLVSSSPDDGNPQLVFELEDGSRFTLTASFEQIEDIADVIDGILDAAAPEDGSSPEQMPAFLRKGRPTA